MIDRGSSGAPMRGPMATRELSHPFSASLLLSSLGFRVFLIFLLSFCWEITYLMWGTFSQPPNKPIRRLLLCFMDSRLCPATRSNAWHLQDALRLFASDLELQDIISFPCQKQKSPISQSCNLAISVRQISAVMSHGFQLHPQRSASGPGLRTYSLVGKVRKRVQRSALLESIKCHQFYQ